MKRHTRTLLALALTLVVIGTIGCAGKKQPTLPQGITVDGLPPLTGELTEKVVCRDESYSAECLQAKTGSEHCKFMMDQNADQALRDKLMERLTSTSDKGGRVSETLETELEIVREFLAQNTIHVQLPKRESNLFHETTPGGEEVVMRFCVIVDEVGSHYYRSLKEKALAADRKEIVEFADEMLDALYDGGVADPEETRETARELQDHFASLYAMARANMESTKK